MLNHSCIDLLFAVLFLFLPLWINSKSIWTIRHKILLTALTFQEQYRTFLHASKCRRYISLDTCERICWSPGAVFCIANFPGNNLHILMFANTAFCSIHPSLFFADAIYNYIHSALLMHFHIK